MLLSFQVFLSYPIASSVTTHTCVHVYGSLIVTHAQRVEECEGVYVHECIQLPSVPKRWSIIVPCTGTSGETGGMNKVQSIAVFILLVDTHFNHVYICIC